MLFPCSEWAVFRAQFSKGHRVPCGPGSPLFPHPPVLPALGITPVPWLPPPAPTSSFLPKCRGSAWPLSTSHLSGSMPSTGELLTSWHNHGFRGHLLPLIPTPFSSKEPKHGKVCVGGRGVPHQCVVAAHSWPRQHFSACVSAMALLVEDADSWTLPQTWATPGWYLRVSLAEQAPLRRTAQMH